MLPSSQVRRAAIRKHTCRMVIINSLRAFAPERIHLLSYHIERCFVILSHPSRRQHVQPWGSQRTDSITTCVEAYARAPRRSASMPPKRSGKRRAARVQEVERVATPDLQIKLLRNVDFSALFTVRAACRAGRIYSVRRCDADVGRFECGCERPVAAVCRWTMHA